MRRQVPKRNAKQKTETVTSKSNESQRSQSDNESTSGESSQADLPMQTEPKSVQEMIADQNAKIAQLQNSVQLLSGQRPLNEDTEMDDYFSEGNDDEIERLLQDGGDLTTDDSDDITDPALKELLDELEKPKDFGPNVEKITAKAFQSVPSYQLTKDMQDKWKTEYKTPENCSNLVVPTVNPEIWNNLPTSAKTSDVKYQAIQLNLVRSLVAQTKVMDLMLKNVPKAILPSLLKPQLDAAKLTGVAVQEINHRRRNNLRSFMRPEYRSLCSNKIPVTSLLFGDNLEASMKSVKTTSSIVRQPNEGFKRFHPYRGSQFRNQPHLNLQRPPPKQNFRGGMTYRNQRPFPPKGQFSKWPNNPRQ